MLDGINIIGNLGSSSGLGNVARMMISVLRANGVRVVGFDVKYDSMPAEPISVECAVVDRLSDLPYKINLVILSMQLLPEFWLGAGRRLTSPSFKNIGLVYWELPVVPSAWRSSLEIFDLILTSSQYVRNAMEISVPQIPTLHVAHPLPREIVVRNREETRKMYEIATSAFVVATSFDLRSSWARKNPEGAVSAFQLAFPRDAGVRLLIKTNQSNGPLPPASRKLLGELRRDNRIIIVENTIPYDQVLSLYACADAYISLHRAEGLGLGPLEAMMLGKPVIATGYSGNMTFMNSLNSYPVRYVLTRPRNPEWQFSKAFAGPLAYWAEPDISHAAKCLESLRSDTSRAQAIALRGRSDIDELQSTAWRASYLTDMYYFIEKSTRYLHRQSLLSRISAAQYTNRFLMKQKIRSIYWKLRKQ